MKGKRKRARGIRREEQIKVNMINKTLYQYENQYINNYSHGSFCRL
jgi:hypothetical protein